MDPRPKIIEVLDHDLQLFTALQNQNTSLENLLSIGATQAMGRTGLLFLDILDACGQEI